MSQATDIQAALDAVKTIITESLNVPDTPHEMVQDMRELQRTLQVLAKQTTPEQVPLEYTISGGAATTSILPSEILTRPLTQAELQAGFTAMNSPEDTIFTSTEATASIAAKQIVISGDDTILTIADRYNADWRQIASLNNLQSPYIAKTETDRYSPAVQSGLVTGTVNGAIAVTGIAATAGQFVVVTGIQTTSALITRQQGNTLYTAPPIICNQGDHATIHDNILNVLTPGQNILIPRQVGDTIGISATLAGDFEEKLFGIDEYLDNTGDMQSSQTRDIQTITALTNLEMQLRHRIITPRGALTELGHPEYGSLVPSMIGKIGTDVWYARILLECELAVSQDPRVQTFNNSALIVDGTAIYFSADVTPIGQYSTISVNLPIG